MTAWRIEPLNSDRHDCSSFSCGDPDLDEYIRKDAERDIRCGAARVFAAFDPSTGAAAGYYSLSAAALRLETLLKTLSPEAPQSQLPYRQIPAALLGRLAVDRRFRNMRLGVYLVGHACRSVLTASETVGMYAVTVDAYETAADFYREKCGFHQFGGNPRKLFMPLNEVRANLTA